MKRCVLSYALLLILPFAQWACRSGSGCDWKIPDSIPAEYRQSGMLRDGDIAITLDKASPKRSRPPFVLWYRGVKLRGVVDGSAYRDVGDYVFALTDVLDGDGSDVRYQVFSGRGSLTRSPKRAHLIDKKDLRVYTIGPFTDACTCLCTNDVVTLVDGCVNVSNQNQKTGFRYDFSSELPRKGAASKGVMRRGLSCLASPFRSFARYVSHLGEWQLPDSIPYEYRRWGVMIDGDIALTRGKATPSSPFKSGDSCVLWFKGLKLEDLVSGDYKDLGDYIFTLTHIRDDNGNEIREHRRVNGVWVSRLPKRAHLIDKKKLKIHTLGPIKDEYMYFHGQCSIRPDVISLTNGCVDVYSRKQKRHFLYDFGSVFHQR